MKTILFSSIHLQDKRHANFLSADLFNWQARALAFFDHPDIFIVERGERNGLCPLNCPIVFAGVPDTKPYHCKDWSYGVAAGNCALSIVMQTSFDLAVSLTTDAILGVDMKSICREFMDRPEVMAGPDWHGSPDTSLVLMKRAAVIDLLYSIPFRPLGANQLYYEHALALIFSGRYWNIWPNVPTVRHEYGTPEQFKGTDDEIIKWPMLVKTSPALAERYRNEHKIGE